MFCQNCGKQIPDESKFCLFCGKEISKIIKIDEPINSKMPVSVSRLIVWLLNEMEDKGRGKVSKKLGLNFQLVDENGDQTSYDGIATIKVQWEQYSTYSGNFGGSSYSTHAKGKIWKDFPITAKEDFFRSKKGNLVGQIVCYIDLGPIIIKSNQATLQTKSEIWFLPKESKKKLYRVETLYS